MNVNGSTPELNDIYAIVAVKPDGQEAIYALSPMPGLIPKMAMMVFDVATIPSLLAHAREIVAETGPLKLVHFRRVEVMETIEP